MSEGWEDPDWDCGEPDWGWQSTICNLLYVRLASWVELGLAIAGSLGWQ
jgi:hypothetical protein